ncbi:MAG TPA: hypothetical protein VK892_17360 [Pyrinomonadaceae bacterium]|nr:hypothetical protein [Pyrinomonadaceae bacterium]
MKILCVFLAFLFICGSLLLTGCSSGSSSVLPPLGSPVKVSPIKVALLLDKSGSANVTRTNQPSFEDLQPVVDRLKLAGGEFALGLVTDNSNKSLLRLRIEPPPVEPAKPADEGDAEKIAAEYDEFRQAQSDYLRLLSEWKTETENRVSKFSSDATELLKTPADAKKTDVFNALNRVDLALAEKDRVFSEDVKKVIILNSDAQDNVKAKLNKLNSGAKLIVVNGIGSVGSLKDLNPELFESLETAVNQVVKGV